MIKNSIKYNPLPSLLPAGSLHAADFLALLSGAEIPELTDILVPGGEIGRIRCLMELQDDCRQTSFFKIDDERYLLEVLYLKLAFLNEIIVPIVSTDEPETKYLRPSMDNLWVRLGDMNSLLPGFWNFKAGFIWTGGGKLETCSGRDVSNVSQLYHCGLFWTAALLTNKNQGFEVLAPAFKTVVEEMPKTAAFEAGDLFQNPASFSPRNILWRVEGPIIRKEWQALCHESVSLGIALGRAGTKRDAEWSASKFTDDLTGLLKRVKGNLFPADYAGDRDNSHSENKIIRRILAGTAEKWKSEQDACFPACEPVNKGEAPEVTQLTESEREAPDDELAETTIIALPHCGGIKALAGQIRQSAAVNETGGTVRAGRSSAMPDDDFMEETVVLDLNKLKGKNIHGPKR